MNTERETMLPVEIPDAEFTSDIDDLGTERMTPAFPLVLDAIVSDCPMCTGTDTNDELIDALFRSIGTSELQAKTVYERYCRLVMKTDCEFCHNRYQNVAMAFDFHRQLLASRKGGDVTEIVRCAEQRRLHLARMGYKPASSRGL